VTNKKIFPRYSHPIWLQVIGWLVVAIMGWMSGVIIADSVAKLF
jgi:hypothetical protein